MIGYSYQMHMDSQATYEEERERKIFRMFHYVKIELQSDKVIK